MKTMKLKHRSLVKGSEGRVGDVVEATDEQAAAWLADGSADECEPKAKPKAKRVKKEVVAAEKAAAIESDQAKRQSRLD